MNTQLKNLNKDKTNIKLLVLRFSSLGDIAQSLFAVDHWHAQSPQNEIHFLTKNEFGPLVQSHTFIQKVHTYDNKTGIKGLWQIAKRLRKEKFNIIYDAHNNLRTLILRVLLFRFSCSVIVRSKNRLRRLLLFKFRVNTFDKPFVGAKSFVQPLNIKFQPNIVSGFQPNAEIQKQPVISAFLKSNSLTNLSQVLLLAPSAAWELKRWPIEYWQSLVHLYKEPIIILGGPNDAFCKEIEKIDSVRIKNLAGELNWLETAALIKEAGLLVSGDTGVLHLSDLLGKRNLAIIGPSAFGFTARPTSNISKTDLSCQPCTKDGRGRCINKEFKKCLMTLKPNMIYEKISFFQAGIEATSRKQTITDNRKSQS